MEPWPLAARLAAHDATVGVVGLGYVGLPLALRLAGAGLRVVGHDSAPAKLARLAAGDAAMRHVAAADLAAALAAGNLTLAPRLAGLSACDALILCVPTPLGPHHEPDMRHVVAAAHGVAPLVVPGRLVVLESTTYPGTTNELLRPLLEAGSGLRAGVDFALAYAPEREDPGRQAASQAPVPQVLGGLTPRCRALGAALYRAAGLAVVEVSSTQVAEMAKLLENVFRSVNIALVNELKVLCTAMGIDVWEVIAAASTKPFGFMSFAPGPGLGGHCIPIDPFYLSWKAREHGLPTRFIELAGQINTQMPDFVLGRLAAALNDRRLPLRGSRVLLLGVAYKRDIDDTRESPALRLLTLLHARGATLCYHDPFVPQLTAADAAAVGGEMLASVPLTPATLSACDAVVIVTDHSAVDYAEVVEHAPLVIDTRNATRAISGPRAHVIHA